MKRKQNLEKEEEKEGEKEKQSREIEGEDKRQKGGRKLLRSESDRE